MYKPIDNPTLFIAPSKQLNNLLKSTKMKMKSKLSLNFSSKELKLLNSLEPINDDVEPVGRKKNCKNVLVNLDTIVNAYSNNINNTNIPLHELIEQSHIILPENEFIPRNQVLEERCKALRNRQAHKDYSLITKDVDTSRIKNPEDTLAFQLKQMNRQIIAVVQFVITVLSGFAFGFLGIELIVGSLDFGFRLLLGIICSLVIALAELYFLAKKLNEDLRLDPEPKKAKFD